MPTTLITGANRGLGLEWVRQLTADGWHVHATCRNPDDAEELNILAEGNTRVQVHRLDVTRPQEIVVVARELKDEPLDLLINNAGVYFERWGLDPLGSIDYDDWEESFRVNSLGPVRVTEAFLDHVARSGQRLVALISSHMGSIADITDGRNYAYRSSKAALNAAGRGLAHEAAEKGVGLLLLHPGWVNTRMGGEDAPHTVEESVGGMRDLVERYEPSWAGRFFKFDGTELPW